MAQKEDFVFCKKEEENIINEPACSYFKSVLKRFVGRKKTIFGLIIIGLIIVLAIFGQYMGNYKYTDIISGEENGITIIANNISPAWLDGGNEVAECFKDDFFIFGTDDLGRDLWARTWHGARISLIIAFVTIFIEVLIGMTYGLISGYLGGTTDVIMQRITEIINSVPTIVIIAVLATIIPKGMILVIVALILTEWIGMNKITRAQTLKIKEMEYIMASKTLGTRTRVIIFREILPNTIGPIITQIMFSIPAAIFTEAFLSFIGVGIVPPDCSLGSLISEGFANILLYPYQMLFPIVVLALLMLGFNALGEGFKEALMPGTEDM